MKKLHRILLVVLAIVLFGYSLVQGQPTIEKRSAVFSPTEEQSSRSTNPLAQPELYNVYYPVESGINILSNIPVPYLSEEDQKQSTIQKSVISFAEKRAIEYLQLYKSVNRVTVVLKLIFPFHSFL